MDYTFVTWPQHMHVLTSSSWCLSTSKTVTCFCMCCALHSIMCSFACILTLCIYYFELSLMCKSRLPMSVGALLILPSGQLHKNLCE